VILLDSAPEVGCFLIVGLAIILEVTFFSSSGFFAVYTVGLLFFPLQFMVSLNQVSQL